MLDEILARAKSPAILASFGKDSLLLVKLAVQTGFKGPIYHLGVELSELAKQAIIEHDLTVYAWPSANRYLIPDGEKLVQVDEFILGRVLIPTISPVVEGDRCDHGNYLRFTRPFKYPHDITLMGYKRGESNGAVGVTFPRELDIGVTRLVNPLYDWTDKQVIDALSFTPPDDNSVEYCNECLAIINSSNWDRDAALVNFRRRFNFSEGDQPCQLPT